MTHRWLPDHTDSVYRPDRGNLVAYDHKVWRVIEVRTEVDWSEAESAFINYYALNSQLKYWPFTLVLRPVSVVGEDPRFRDHDLSLLIYRYCVEGACEHDTEEVCPSHPVMVFNPSPRLKPGDF